MSAFLRSYGLFIAWLIALVATVATVLIDITLHWPVCTLCWYQRIAIYPLVILLGIATYRDDQKIIIYALPFLIAGALLSLYQYLEQMIPGFAPLEVCTLTTPCNNIHFLWWGFVTLPFLSFVACIVMIVMLIFNSQQP